MCIYIHTFMYIYSVSSRIIYSRLLEKRGGRYMHSATMKPRFRHKEGNKTSKGSDDGNLLFAFAAT